MNNVKGFKYYIFIFVMSSLAIFIYLAINSFGGNQFTIPYMVSILTIPFTFTILMFVFDRILGWIIPKNKPKKEDSYGEYLKEWTAYLQTKEEFEIEDFKKFRNNERFQRTLKILHRIQLFGETSDANYKMVEKRFKKDTKEYKAIQYLVNRK